VRPVIHHSLIHPSFFTEGDEPLPPSKSLWSLGSDSEFAPWIEYIRIAPFDLGVPFQNEVRSIDKRIVGYWGTFNMSPHLRVLRVGNNY